MLATYTSVFGIGGNGQFGSVTVNGASPAASGCQVDYGTSAGGEIALDAVPGSATRADGLPLLGALGCARRRSGG